MDSSLKTFVFLSIILILCTQIQAKPKITRIDDTNFDKFSKDGSYWIIQISNTPCPECQSH